MKTQEISTSDLSRPMHLVLALARLSDRLTKRVERALGRGVSFNEMTLMLTLHQAPEQTMRRIDLAEAIGLSASGVTRMLAPMEKTGLVAKQSSERDARISAIRLTAAGDQALRDVLGDFEHSAEEAVQALSVRQQEAMLASCATLLNRS
jgi:DNA-binding MarR family transcriptional regulator